MKGIRVEKVILYGSYASGKIHAGSDLDVPICSIKDDNFFLKSCLINSERQCRLLL